MGPRSCSDFPRRRPHPRPHGPCPVGVNRTTLTMRRSLPVYPGKQLRDRMTIMIEVNGRAYAKPKRSTVVVCLDGCDPRYLNFKNAEKDFTNISRMMRNGFSTLADAAMPTFTNPNNVSIVTGAPPAVHGISGNYYLDRATGKEIMIVDASPMRATTILAEMSRAGVRVAAVNGQDKLPNIAGPRMKGGSFFSVAKAPSATASANTIVDSGTIIALAKPYICSPDFS